VLGVWTPAQITEYSVQIHGGFNDNLQIVKNNVGSTWLNGIMHFYLSSAKAHTNLKFRWRGYYGKHGKIIEHMHTRLKSVNRWRRRAIIR